MKRRTVLLLIIIVVTSALLLTGYSSSKSVLADLQFKTPPVIVFQPSHQSDTGKDFNEGLVCSAIVDAALAAPVPGTKQFKVWSYYVPDLHHAQAGSNTKISHTTAVDSGRISGYAYEINESNKIGPDLFIAVHNNGGTNKHYRWGFVHEGDPNEEINRELARVILNEICTATNLFNAGVHGDSEPNRNDYRCVSTGKLSFYSLDEHVNKAPYRLLLEIGDNAVSREFLLNADNQKKIGEAIQRAIKKIVPPQEK
jgi:N-acetylmuramoyl-L-alanine amidase